MGTSKVVRFHALTGQFRRPSTVLLRGRQANQGFTVRAYGHLVCVGEGPRYSRRVAFRAGHPEVSFDPSEYLVMNVREEER